MESTCTVDLVMPTVNCNDPCWMRQYVKTFLMNPQKLKRISGNRYRELGLLKYIFRSIEVNAPWISNVHLLVSSDTQVPDWIQDVHVVTHDEFIPKSVLPTFNSCTIESFLANIPGLPEKFIYSNDDLMFNNPTTYDMFFDDDGNPKINFKCMKSWNHANIFRSQVNNSINMICKMVGVQRISDEKLIVPMHSFFPMLRDTVKKVYDHNKDELIRISTKDRTNKNVNQYIYSFYQYYTHQFSPSPTRFMYATLTSPIETIREILLENPSECVCLNDCDASDVNIDPIIEILETKFPKKSRFER